MKWFSLRSAAIGVFACTLIDVYFLKTRTQIDNSDLIKNAKALEINTGGNKTTKDTVIMIPLNASDRFRYHVEPFLKDGRITVEQRKNSPSL